MRVLTFTALVAGFLASSSAAVQLFQREASPAVVRLATHRKAVENPVKRDALRRRQTVTETLDNGVSSHSPMHSLRESRNHQRWCLRPYSKLGVEGPNPALDDFFPILAMCAPFSCLRTTCPLRLQMLLG